MSECKTCGCELGTTYCCADCNDFNAMDRLGITKDQLKIARALDKSKIALIKARLKTVLKKTDRQELYLVHLLKRCVDDLPTFTEENS